MNAEWWRAWSFPIPPVAAMLGMLLAYLVLWRRAGARRTAALAFVGGMAALVLALYSPIDTVGSCCLLSVHMVQHALQLLLAPALLLWGLHGVLPPMRGRPGHMLAWLTRPDVALPLLLANLYLWHLPVAYEAALATRPVHDAEHLLYLLSGLLYWWGVTDPIPLPGRPPLSLGRKLAYLLVGSLAMMPLGLIIMWAPRPLYPHYVRFASATGQSALYDQQVAAVVMLGSGGALMVAALMAGLQALGGTGQAQPVRKS